MHLSRILLTAAASLSILTLRAAEKLPDAGFSVKIFPSKARNIADQFAGILPQRPPCFPLTGSAVCGEPFSLHVTFFGAKPDRNRFRLTGKITVTDPAGKKTEIPLKEQNMDFKEHSGGVFLYPQELRCIFEPQDPRGTYRFEAELTDCNADRTAKDCAEVRYVEKTYPQPGVQAWKKLADYYRSPSPEYILPAFGEFLAGLPKQKEKEKKDFNPLPQLAFFYFLLRDNPQCVTPFAERMKSLSGENRMLAAVVLCFALPAPSADLLPADEQKRILKMFPANPFEIDRVTLPWHLDVCWAEFLVRGTRTPAMKAVKALELASDSLSVKEFRAIASPSEEDRRRLLRGLTAYAASWSIGSLAKQHPLLRWYIEAALRRGEIKDPFAAALAAKAVGMQLQIGGKDSRDGKK